MWLNVPPFEAWFATYRSIVWQLLCWYVVNLRKTPSFPFLNSIQDEAGVGEGGGRGGKKKTLPVFLNFTFNPFSTLVQNFKFVPSANPKLLNLNKGHPSKTKLLRLQKNWGYDNFSHKNAKGCRTLVKWPHLQYNLNHLIKFCWWRIDKNYDVITFI